ncbi:DTW domain-containing protein [Parashewanella spongiae]|uniref:tRNA-uridine aminocarboxypropyltransferase n=1 Tax=Parashewanella spongiae TaxID=342950 RepID=A0A3A6U8G5_9GAMM|nr:DTW domain-containing protein [Parashewanella spongiae]MCL1078679.1 DTW domain-containing protein [Parashewanella spongiae]RJY12948.1 DTW domain-containing protein [Parashewanella spongiae]
MSILHHQFHKLYQYRKSISTKVFSSRGKNLSRCDFCLQGISFCVCDSRRQLISNTNFLLLMHDDEILKPSNSGRLVADLIPNTTAFLWSRVDVEQALIDLIDNDTYQPVLIFPSDYAKPEREVFESVSDIPALKTKPPLFILLDGTWRQAVKIFRKSSYLDKVPMLSFSPEHIASYAVRKGQRDFQMGTAEVAALAIDSFGEKDNANALVLWCNVFKEATLRGRNKRSAAELQPFNLYKDAFSNAHKKAIQNML